MNIFELLEDLGRRGIRVRAHPRLDELKVQGPSPPSGEVREAIRAHKDTLVWLARIDARVYSVREEPK